MMLRRAKRRHRADDRINKKSKEKKRRSRSITPYHPSVGLHKILADIEFRPFST